MKIPALLRKVAGWPVLVIGALLLGSVFFVLVTKGPSYVEWKALLPAAGFIVVGLAWIKGQSP